MRFTRGVVFAILIFAVFTGRCMAQGEPATGMTGKFAVTPFVGGSLPIQYLEETNGGGRAEIGFAGGISGEYFINDEVSVGGRFVYDRFGMDVPDPASGNWTILEFGAFARFLFMKDMSTRPFLMACAMVAKADVESENGNDSEIDIALAPGGEIAGGVIHEVSDNVSLYGEIGWTAIATDGKDADLVIEDTTIETREFEKHLQWIGVKAGVTILFGGG